MTKINIFKRSFYNVLEVLTKMVISLTILIIVSCGNFAQKTDENPNLSFFDKYLSSNSQYEMLKISFPTLEECKLVYKDPYATTYFNWLNQIQTDYFKSGKTTDFLSDFGTIRYVFDEEEETLINNGDKKFKTVKTDIISTSVFKEEWKKYYQSNVNIYRIIFLNAINDEYGFEHNGFVFINNQWKFFPKPKRSIFSN